MLSIIDSTYLRVFFKRPKQPQSLNFKPQKMSENLGLNHKAHFRKLDFNNSNNYCFFPCKDFSYFFSKYFFEQLYYNLISNHSDTYKVSGFSSSVSEIQFFV
jgi:hypothetical protein